jgi:hypothetical protein
MVGVMVEDYRASCPVRMFLGFASNVIRSSILVVSFVNLVELILEL